MREIRAAISAAAVGVLVFGTPNAYAAVVTNAQIAASAKALGLQISSIKTTPIRDVYVVESAAGGNKGKVVFTGNGRLAIVGHKSIVDQSLGRTLTEPELQALKKDMFARFDRKSAITLKYGKGTKEVILWSAIDCPVCVKLDAQMERLGDDVTVYLVPTALSPSADKQELVRRIYCASSPEQAWHAWMKSGTIPPVVKKDCGKDYDFGAGFALAMKGVGYGVYGTPTIFYADGSSAYIYKSLEIDDDKSWFNANPKAVNSGYFAGIKNQKFSGFHQEIPETTIPAVTKKTPGKAGFYWGG